MRGKKPTQPPMFFAINVEDRVAADHPLRAIKTMVDEELARMNTLFDEAYADTGRPSVPPERLLKALLLRSLYSVRSDTQLIERINTDLLFRWFLDMDPAQEVFDATAFTHNRPRLEKHGIVAAFFQGVVKRAMNAGLTSDDHFSVDGTLIESYASIKSFVPRESKDQGDQGDGNGFKPRNDAVDFHGQKRSNDTHQSTTDPEARLFRKGNAPAARLYHLGHAIAENRHGLVMAVELTAALSSAEPQAATTMLDRMKQQLKLEPTTLGADKAYDSGAFLLELESREIRPHVATRQNKIAGLAGKDPEQRRLIKARRRMRRREKGIGYPISQRCRKKIEEAFGWIKTVAGLCRTRLVGRWKIKQEMELAAAAYNLVRMRKLTA
jgi:transposase